MVSRGRTLKVSSMDLRSTSQRHDSEITATNTMCQDSSEKEENRRKSPLEDSDVVMQPKRIQTQVTARWAGILVINWSRASEARAMQGLYKQGRARLHSGPVSGRKQYKLRGWTRQR